MGRFKGGEGFILVGLYNGYISRSGFCTNHCVREMAKEEEKEVRHNACGRGDVGVNYHNIQGRKEHL